MINSIVEFIQNSVTTVVGLAVGALGMGGTGLLNNQTANISEVVATPTEEVITLEEGIVLEEDNEISLPEIETEVETEYFDRIDLPEPIFIRPLTTEEAVVSLEEDIPVLVQTTESIRPINPIQSTKKPKEIDASILLKINFDEFDPNLKITKITEDDNNFYSSYQFNSFAIKNNAWQAVIKEKQISVTKIFLGQRDLGQYLSQELSEVVDNEIIFLKEVQVIQKAKLSEAQESSEDQTLATSSYDALIGKVLDIENEQFDDYTPKEEVLPEPVEEDTPEDEVISTGAIDNEPPLIVIQGNNPALIQQGSSYSDLGAKVTDNVSDNLGVLVGGDVVNTEVENSYYVTYTATDEAGNVATATREVIVYAYDAPEVEQIIPVIEESEELSETEVPTTPVEEVATTTEIVEELSEVKVVDDSLTSVETIVETTDVIIETVIKGGKEAKKKVKETAEDVSETITTVIEEVSTGVETVTEEVSALIKKVHFLELLGNIKSSLQGKINNTRINLQASVSVAGGEASNFFKTLESFFEPIKKGVQAGTENLKEFFKEIFENINLDKIIYQTPNGVLANIGDYDKVSIKEAVFVQEENFQGKDFFSSVKDEFIALPGKMVGRITASILNVFEFFKNHRPGIK